MSGTTILHGTAVAVAGRAVLIRGASGAGKSDLALRCLALMPGALVVDAPRLVADDRVVVDRRGAGLVVRAPETLAGLLEVRGLGIVRVPAVSPAAELTLVADLVAPGEVERMPEPGASVEILGAGLPLIRIAPFEASAPLKLMLALAGGAPFGPGK